MRSQQIMQARMHIADIARDLLRAKGGDADEGLMARRGAAAVLRRNNVPLRELGVHEDWLLVTGHAELGDLGWGGDEDQLPKEDWDDEEGYGERVDPEEAWPYGEEPEGPPPEGFDSWGEYYYWEQQQYGERHPEQEGEPAPELPPGFVAPGAVPIRPGNWDLTTTPPRYRVASGDTLTGLAKTYLDDGMRWPEIWAMQPQSYKDSGRSPDDIFVGDWLAMPEEAADKVRDKPGVKGGDTSKDTLVKAALLVGVALAAGGVVYVATR